MAISLMPSPRQRFYTNGGIPAAGCLLYTYEAGTSTPKAAYTDAEGLVPHTNPILLDSKGETLAYLSGAYKIDLKTAAGVQITGFPVDDVVSFDSVVDAADALLRSQLAAGDGASRLGFSHSETYADGTAGAALKRFVTVTNAPFNADSTGATDCTAAFAAAVAYVIAGGAGGVVWAPAGEYKLLGGAVAPDGFKNGILFPDTGLDFTTANGVMVEGDGISTVLKAGASNMIVVRSARLHSGVRNVKIDGIGFSNVWAGAIVPEDMTQTTELVSHSFQRWDICAENCTEALVFQPGPTVLGADSGCFYHEINLYTNLCTRAVWMKKDVTGSGNRTTRTNFRSLKVTRGNTGVMIDGGTEISFYGPSFEMVSSGVTPSAVPTAFNYTDTNPANIRLYGGYAEACTRALEATTAGTAQIAIYGFEHNSTKHASEFLMGRFNTGRLTVPKLSNVAGYINVGGEAFAGFVVDPDQTGAKVIECQTNFVARWRVDAAGIFTKYGTTGNIVFNAAGTDIAFSRDGANTISALGAAAQLVYRANTHIWQNGSAVNMVSMNATVFSPSVDNAMTCGANGNRFSAVWAANGTIQTSDPRTKTDIQDSPLGLDFILQLKPKAYRFKVGGNKIVGEREIKPAVLDDDGNVLEQPIMEAIIEPQPGKRLHYGFLTTEVKAAMDRCKVEDFGGYVKTDMADPESEEGLRYESFIAPMVLAIQQLTARVAQLEGGEHDNA